MKILGIDWGESKMGLALADGPLPQPWKVLKYTDRQNLLADIGQIVADEGITKIVVGVSEGVSGQRAREFGESLRQLGVEVDFGDETLTTHEAQQIAKRGKPEDAIAAAFMLQSYLENRE